MRHDIIPGLVYADAPRAIDFLCAAFGFTRHAVHADPQDPMLIHHAQLVWRDRMIMLSTATDSATMQAVRMQTPSSAGGATMGLYLVVDEVDAHAATAAAAGATIVLPPNDKDYGGRGYSALDQEGNVWSFGSYDPWA